MVRQADSLESFTCQNLRWCRAWKIWLNLQFVQVRICSTDGKVCLSGIQLSQIDTNANITIEFGDNNHTRTPICRVVITAISDAMI